MDYSGDDLNISAADMGKLSEIQFPPWRRLQLRHLKGMFAAIRDKEKISRNAFDAIDIIARRKPDEIFWSVIQLIGLPQYRLHPITQ